MKKSIISTLLAAQCCTAIFAANITWNGGTGNWNTAANWSTGTVPTANDDVTINSGNVTIWTGYNAFAKSVRNIAGVLTIRVGGSLTISGSTASYGLQNFNRLIVNGNLTITDLNDIPSDGIDNNDSIEINLTAMIVIDGFPYGIDNNRYTKNAGLVQVTNSIIGIQQFFGTSSFANTSSGIANIESTENCIKMNAGSIFTNDGDLNLGLNSPLGFTALNNSGGVFTNNIAGYVTINTNINSSTGIGCVDSGSFTNWGTMYVSAPNGIVLNNFAGLAPGPTFVNAATGAIYLTTSSRGLYVATSLTNFTNSGLIEISISGGEALRNYSPNFMNSNCAEIVLHGSLINTATGIIQNSGSWYMYTTTPSTNSGSFQHNGILEDNAASLYPLITNSRLIVRSITGPLVAGMPVANVLNVSTWGVFQPLGIFADSTTATSAGTYVQATNSFTPNAAAVGLPSLYIKIRRGNNGCTEIFRIEVLNPVPIVMPDGETNVIANSNQFQPDFSLFPNPTTGRFSLRGKAAKGPVEVLLADAFGRVVLQQHIDFQEVETYQFGAGQLLGAGLYFLKIMENGAPIWQEKLLVNGH